MQLFKVESWRTTGPVQKGSDDGEVREGATVYYGEERKARGVLIPSRASYVNNYLPTAQFALQLIHQVAWRSYGEFKTLHACLAAETDKTLVALLPKAGW